MSLPRMSGDPASRAQRVIYALAFLAAMGAAGSLPALGSDQPRQPVPRLSQADIGRIDRLLELIQKRLERAPALAEERWKAMSRIEDAASENRLLEAARSRAAVLKLDPDLAARFAQAQVDAAKIIQAERHKQWAATPSAAPSRGKVPDPLAATTAEPELDTPLLSAWRDALPVLRKPDARAVVDARAADRIHVGGTDLLAAQVALKPLYEIANPTPNGRQK